MRGAHCRIVMDMPYVDVRPVVIKYVELLGEMEKSLASRRAAELFGYRVVSQMDFLVIKGELDRQFLQSLGPDWTTLDLMEWATSLKDDAGKERFRQQTSWSPVEVAALAEIVLACAHMIGTREGQ